MSLKKYIAQNNANLDTEKVSDSADDRFEMLLKTSLHQPKKTRIRSMYYVAAASIALLLTIGVWFTDKATEKAQKQAVLANLEDSSAGNRLEGIYTLKEKYTEEDEQIISILIRLLHEDSSVNVKIAAIDALMLYSDNQLIRSNLIAGLENEKEPLVQIKLIKSLSLLKAKGTSEILNELIENNEILPIVKNNAELAMATFKNE